MTAKNMEKIAGELHCRLCAHQFEKTLKKIRGIESVSVNFDDQVISLRFDTDILAQADIETALTKVKQQIVHPDLREHPILTQRVFMLILSGLSFTLGFIFFWSPLESSLQLARGLTLTISNLFYLLSVGLSGIYVLRSGVKAAIERRLSIDALMTIAIIGAIAIGEFFEAASLVVLYSLAELLEERVIARAKNSLAALMELAPQVATVLRGNHTSVLPVTEVKIEDVIAIRPGDRVPLDGIVLSGKSYLNQAPITGESLPVEKSPGDLVYAGSLNHEGYIEVCVQKLAQDSTLSKILQLVERAEAEKSPTERFIDQFGRYYTPTIVVLAAFLAVIPPVALGQPFVPWFLRAITLLVISCPCALLISTPVAVISGITAAAKNGVLIKGGKYLEAMGQVKTIAIDKTGTLTRGQLTVTDIVPLNGTSTEDIIQIAASLETKSNHPIAQAIVRAAGDANLLEVQEFHSLTGSGVEGSIQGKHWRVGKPVLFPEFHSELLERFQKDAKTVVVVGNENSVLGLIAVEDEIRPEAKSTVQALNNLGIQVVMLTGDNTLTAKAVANELGISQYHAEVLPQEKLEILKNLQEKSSSVAMIGDGVNDAPALATATVGIAMGVIGTDTALETADIALMTDDLSKLPYLVELSRRGRSVIKQNVWFSILTKATLALGVLPGYVTLAMAVLIGDLGATLSVTANAMRLGSGKNKVPLDGNQ